MVYELNPHTYFRAISNRKQLGPTLSRTAGEGKAALAAARDGSLFLLFLERDRDELKVVLAVDQKQQGLAVLFGLLSAVG